MKGNRHAFFVFQHVSPVTLLCGVWQVQRPVAQDVLQRLTGTRVLRPKLNMF